MSYENRKKIIQKIEQIRGSKVITYFVTSKPGVISNMEQQDVRKIFDLLPKNKSKIDLFIYSFGGDTTVSWSLSNLIRHNSEKFSVLVPYYAYSCATALSIAADEIIMGPMGTLGPIDPQVTNLFNPLNEFGQRIPISVEDISGYSKLANEKFNIQSESGMVQVFLGLLNNTNPFALGNVYRHYLKCREDAKKLLELHMDSEKESDKIKKITEILVEKLYYHGHPINRVEAGQYGLKIKFAEDFKNNLDSLNDLMWELYLDYEKDFVLNVPYEDSVKNGLCNKIPLKSIENNKDSLVLYLVQDFVDLGFPKNSPLTFLNNQYIIIVDNTSIPLVCSGTPVWLGGKVYDKRERTEWIKNDARN